MPWTPPTLRTLSALLLALGLAACASDGDATRPDKHDADARPALIEMAVDLRPFNAGTADPGLPSLTAGNGPEASANYRKTVIARVPAGADGGGHDIRIPDGGNVEQQARVLVARGLALSGYRVLAEGEPVPPDALRVRAGVREFWAWRTTGMGAESREAKLLIEIIALGPKGKQQFVVPAYGVVQGAPGNEGDWHAAFARAYEDYAFKQKVAFKQYGL